MADQPKKKRANDVKRNDERRNGKAFKSPDAPRNRRTRLTELQKALLGGGAMRRIAVARTMTRKESEDDA